MYFICATCFDLFWPLALIKYICYAQRSKTLSRKNNHNVSWHYRNSQNVKLCVATVLKQPQRVVAWGKQPQREMSFKWTVYMFSNLLLRNTCNVGLLKNNGEAHLVLQELSEWHLCWFDSWSPNSLWSFPLTAMTRLSHHGISSHATTCCGCLKTVTTRNFAL